MYTYNVIISLYSFRKFTDKLNSVYVHIVCSPWCYCCCCNPGNTYIAWPGCEKLKLDNVSLASLLPIEFWCLRLNKWVSRGSKNIESEGTIMGACTCTVGEHLAKIVKFLIWDTWWRKICIILMRFTTKHKNKKTLTYF